MRGTARHASDSCQIGNWRERLRPKQFSLSCEARGLPSFCPHKQRLSATILSGASDDKSIFVENNACVNTACEPHYKECAKETLRKSQTSVLTPANRTL